MSGWLVTGGAGYIGAHVVRALLAAGHEAVVVDDLSTGLRERVPHGVELVVRGVDDPRLADRMRSGIDGIVHLAAKKSVPASVIDPLTYYEQNVSASVALLRAAVAAGVGAVLYSSSAAVYGATGDAPVTEDHPTAPTSPYGATKLAAEWAVRAAAEAHGLRWCALRYFNVAGAADAVLADGGVTNLLPVAHAAVSSGDPMTVFGTDWPTPDGTCVRDYVHVEDLADAHVAAVDGLADGAPGVLNVGRGAGVGVLGILDAVARTRGRPVPHVLGARRPGDPARVVADCSRIAARLGWRAVRDVDAMAALPDPAGGLAP